MGQKVHPIGFRLGITKTWSNRWFAKKDYTDLLHEDLRLEASIKHRLRYAGVSKICIERRANDMRINIHAARPGLIIGKKGVEVEKLKKELQKQTDKQIFLDIHEIKHPELDAQLVAVNVALQLERRVSYRRAMKKAVSTILRFGGLGVRISCAGRLGGHEIARTEWYREGRVPLHTLKADIDYGFAEAKTTYGVIGVKTWIFRGEIEKEKSEKSTDAFTPQG